ncbi:MAG: hypothetical protein UW07_C0021G0010 [Candidatus Nomurabacteria bacterium GW2011_GWF2_43_8]|uniref:Uncharacterized protein n=3 Tax=Candidatus Nomuraibacteriota TaxID=1752729 RepID=A0A0G1FMR9_9BACT|nr:MAG: hypothetical protein UV76_C0008G0033 [Candidatus Nomurabacteria bacterium GW2011_GWA2_43_15]KKT19774.1 MAG: hypothetical protein UW02_C0005G0009 [Candidatus Nomurabacteria bacterium GW2011_GWB1_43_7]KKT23726.1 MAG: hypothetical protein UW07_C0021G0010 [Candidatus Nomurabacteria bacterium GW2011_GWF2_43_8]
MSSSPESRYIRNIDAQRLPPQKTIEGLGKSAEGIVIDCMNEKLRDKGMTVRPATKFEDSGVKHEGGKQVDAVVYYMGGKPAMCIQITTAQNQSFQMEKVKQLTEKPFVRLEEMKNGDVPIPKVVVGLNPKDVESFLNNPDFSQHPQIWEKISSNITECLQSVQNMTKYDKEKAKAQELLLIFQSEGSTSH